MKILPLRKRWKRIRGIGRENRPGNDIIEERVQKAWISIRNRTALDTFEERIGNDWISSKKVIWGLFWARVFVTLVNSTHGVKHTWMLNKQNEG